MNKAPPVGTIVRAFSSDEDENTYAVVVPREWSRVRDKWSTQYAFTRPLGPYARYFRPAVEQQGGWYIGNGDSGEYTYTIISDDDVPDEIIALATRCLLDREFIPFVNEANNV